MSSLLMVTSVSFNYLRSGLRCNKLCQVSCGRFPLCLFSHFTGSKGRRFSLVRIETTLRTVYRITPPDLPSINRGRFVTPSV